MGGLELFGELEHVVMFSTDNPVAPHLGRIRRRNRNGNRIVMHIQTNEQDESCQQRRYPASGPGTRAKGLIPYHKVGAQKPNKIKWIRLSCPVATPYLCCI
jgi:hypothetical protein